MRYSLKQSAVKGFASFESRLARSIFFLTLFYSIILGLILLISASITYSAFSSRITTRFNRVPPSAETIRIIQEIRKAEIRQIQVNTSTIEATRTVPSSQPIWPTAEEVQEDLIASLIFVNGCLLLIAIGGSYFLARLTLRPLKHAYQEQRRFIADASHELRTPLAVMKIELENELTAIEQGYKGAEIKDSESVKSQLEEVDRMSKIVQNLLLLSKLDGAQITSPQMKVVPIDLTKSVSDITNKLQTLAKKYNVNLTLVDSHASTDTASNSKPILIKGNDQITHILTNIIQNAILYNKANGSVYVLVGMNKSVKSFVTVTVKDTGVGISKEDLAHIFDRFYRVDKSRSRATGGSGLGLSIVERGIKSIGGNISIESELDKGTTVKLTFKRA